MAVLVTDCPRCGAKKMTLDVLATIPRFTEAGWKDFYEVFAICRACKKSGTFLISLREYNYRERFREPDKITKYEYGLDNFFNIEGVISIKDRAKFNPPEHMPTNIETAFREAAACMTLGCWNAAGSMFRACVDLATRPLLPDPTAPSPQPPNRKTRRDLGLRLPWLFQNGLLDKGLEPLATCIREDGNDGVHQVTLKKEDAEDLLDFTVALLERMYTEPERLRQAEARRLARREAPPGNP